MMRLFKILIALITALIVSSTARVSMEAHAPHEHVYNETLTDATCTETGYVTYQCECGDTYTQEVLPAGHSYRETEHIEATCQTEGRCLFVCERCGDILQEILPREEHKYGVTDIIDATCTSDGLVSCYCKTCGTLLSTEKIPALEHDYKTVTIAPTCTDNGEVLLECNRCGYCLTAKVIPATGHKYEATTVKATCTKGGYTQYECTICQSRYIDNETNPTGHHFTISGEHVDPTCGTEGYQIYSCECGEMRKDVLSPTGQHRYKSAVTKQPNYEEEGVTTYRCTVCGRSYTESIPKVPRPKVDLTKHSPIVNRDSLPENIRWSLEAVEAEYSKRLAEGDMHQFLIHLPFEMTAQDISQLNTYLICEAGGFQQKGWLFSKYSITNASPNIYVYIDGQSIPASEFNEYGAILVNMQNLHNYYEECKPVKQWIHNIVANFTEGDNLHLVTQIFDYVKNHFTYSLDSCWLKSLMNTNTGTCNAYSLFVRHCCMELGIRCDVIVGIADNDGYHAWNMISINGKPTFWDAVYQKRNCSKPFFHGKILNDISKGVSRVRALPDMQYPTVY